jgi:hypothetical protein
MMQPVNRFSREENLAQQPWGLWWMQAQRLTRIELRRNLFSWKATWIYCLAFIPPSSSSFICWSIGILLLEMSDDTNILAGIVQLYYIRLGVFFGCLGIFSRLIRGEMIERSLHFYLLSPVQARGAAAGEVRRRLHQRRVPVRKRHRRLILR